jgi:hypothetical protein
MNYKATLTQKKATHNSQNLVKTAKLKLIGIAQNSWQHELRSRIVSGFLTFGLGTICYLILRLM